MQPWELADWKFRIGSNFDAGSFLERVDDVSAGEELIEAIGAKTVDSLDASDYEDASIIQNLNQPLPPELKLSFDVVFDGGTLEHVFDYTTALSNSLALVKPGGWFLSHCPTNMWCGHGFYQLSPQVFIEALSEKNGFSLELLAFAVDGYRRKYWVWDLQEELTNRRLGIYSKRPAGLLVAARRISPNIPKRVSGEQSDYVSRWNSPESTKQSNPKSVLPRSSLRHLRSMLTSILPWFIRGRLRLWIAKRRKIAAFQKGLRRSKSL